jgi:hypothetical protein
LATLNLNLKKTLVVAVLGAVLFVGSFVASDRINASNIFCGPENIWFDLSQAAAEIGLTGPGVAPVEVTVL